MRWLIDCAHAGGDSPAMGATKTKIAGQNRATRMPAPHMSELQPDDDEDDRDEQDQQRPDVELLHLSRPRKFTMFTLLRARTRGLAKLSIYCRLDFGDAERVT